MNAPSDPVLAPLWQRVLSSFDQDGVHQAFLEAARQRRKLGEAARAYRQAAKDHDKRNVAEAQLATITALAFAELDASRTPMPAKRPLRMALLVFALALGMLGLASALVRLIRLTPLG